MTYFIEMEKFERFLYQNEHILNTYIYTYIYILYIYMTYGKIIFMAEKESETSTPKKSQKTDLVVVRICQDQTLFILKKGDNSC